MWLIEEAAFKKIEHAQNNLGSFSVGAFRAQDPNSNAMPATSDVMNIYVQGVLTKRPDLFMSMIFGANTSYEGIISALDYAQKDPAIKSVAMYVDSPGGNVDGLFDVLGALQSFNKPIAVKAANAQSAAYAIASVAGPIEATGRGASFGSIGTAASFQIEQDVITLTNTDSPAKRPDPTTEEGKKVIVQYLDAVNSLFVEGIASGRKTSVDNITKNFGRGASFLADEAQRRGMIDTIAQPVLRVVAEAQKPAASGKQQGNKKMDVKTLASQHPETYEAILELGAKQERDRVVAHLHMGEQSGDTKTAFAAIRDGEGMTQTLTAKYLAAAMNRNDRKARQEESDEAAAIVGEKKTDVGMDQSMIVAQKVCEKLGVTFNG